MNVAKLRKLIQKREGVGVEFKRASTEIPRDIYKTVCSFLNTFGGDIFLGVADDGTVLGVDPEYINQMKKSFSDSVNNLHNINPPFCAELKEYEIDDKIILHAFIPESSQPHKYGSKIYIRNYEVDNNITDNIVETTNLYIRKNNTYSENKIFKFLKESDLRTDLIKRARELASSLKPMHHWNKANNLDFLKSLSLYQKNNITGEQGFTLACILLFGTDETIASALPAFKIDLIKRVDNPERYDDRVTLRTNLLDCYDRSMEFINKHLPDSFYLEKGLRKSLRELIFREIISNMIVHKEYSFGEATRLIIEKNKIFVENSNRPRVNGIIGQNRLEIYPKNPNICKFFREIGIVEDLGSGFENLYKYCNQYNGSDPIIKDEHIFSVELAIPFFSIHGDKIQITAQAAPPVHEQVEGLKVEQTIDTSLGRNQPAPQANEQVEGLKVEQTIDTSLGRNQPAPQAKKNIIDFCTTPKTLREIVDYMGFKDIKHFRKKHLLPLIKQGLLIYTQPDKPTSPLQKYVKK